MTERCTYYLNSREMHQALNMGRTTLWRKLKQYQIDIRDYKL
nr:helix-turn-helix domain-containing protein [Providencia rustigianii]